MTPREETSMTMEEGFLANNEVTHADILQHTEIIAAKGGETESSKQSSKKKSRRKQKILPAPDTEKQIDGLN